jgi:hypothetical protein
MIYLLNAIAKIAAPADMSCFRPDNDEVCVVASTKPRPGYLGLVFKQNILMVDYRSTMCFRIEYGNLGFHRRMTVGHPKHNLSAKQLDIYFQEYAVGYVLNRIIHRGDSIKSLVQLPPISTYYPDSKSRELAINQLIQKAEPLDLVFSRPIKESSTSTLIRMIDRSQFSHTGIYLGDGITSDAGPSGVKHSSLAELGKNSHLALYRPSVQRTDSQKDQALAMALSMEGAGYNWKGLLELYMRILLKLPRTPPLVSIRDLLFMTEELRLIDYV